MGMAASQARYLGLSARKTNVEFEGQQVNQQRTALANESAGLFRKMLELENPVPPNESDYNTQIYTYSDPNVQNGTITVTDIIEEEGTNPPTYSVYIKYPKTESIYGAIPNKNVSTQDNGETIIFNGVSYALTELDGIGSKTVEELNKVLKEQDSSHVDWKTSDTYYTFKNGPYTYYINATTQNFDVTNSGEQTLNVAYVESVTKTQSETLKNVTVTTTEDGLYSTMYYTDTQGVSQKRTLSVGQEKDDVAYDAALQKYNADKIAYEKEIADINAKTQELQETDRTLELRLKQLDTEQQALQTEMESIKKVIDKQVDNVFKTFQ